MNGYGDYAHNCQVFNQVEQEQRLPKKRNRLGKASQKSGKKITKGAEKGPQTRTPLPSKRA
jgi:hypothetical protein